MKPALIVLASNLPGLAMQTVLPALAVGRPLVLRSSTREPYFAPALLRSLADQEPAIGQAFAALTGPHNSALESTLLERCDPVLAYGGRRALRALRTRAPGRFEPYGPKLSIGLVGPDAEEAEVEHLARDVALFDQRGCLSVQLVCSRRPVEAVARALARGLETQATRLPPGPATFEESAAVGRELDLARLRGHVVVPTKAGSVVIEPAEAPLSPSPGRRVVRVRQLDDWGSLTPLLAPWRYSLQGAALAGVDAGEVAVALSALGFSRLAEAGKLQETDVRWHNGGVDPLEVLGDPP
jgi:acyl-CoA reductase-like NAD-dependent aldehyde dehydrogenase